MIQEALDPDFEAILGGRAPAGLRLPDGWVQEPETLTMLRELANQIRLSFAPASWMIVNNSEVVGLCSLIKAPARGAIDIGYGVFDVRRGRGHASGAVQDLLIWARGDERVLTCRAETSIANIPSQRVLDRNGFNRVGTRYDEEDGELFCWSITVGG